MQLFFKEHFWFIVFQKLKDWKLEKCCMKDDICLLDHHQRSHWEHDHNWSEGNDQLGSTVEHQPVGKLVQQSFGEAPRDESSKPSQSKPNPICDRTGKPVETERVFVEKGKTSHSQEIVGKRLQEELGSSDRTGKPVKCEEKRVLKDPRSNGETCGREARTKCKKLVLSNILIVHRQTRTSSTLQSMRKTLTSTSQACRTRWWNDHMASTFTTWFSRSRITLNDKHFKVIFNNIEHSILSSKESKDAITAAGNTELCEIVDVEPKSQCRACLTYWERWHRLLHVWTLLAKDDTTENKKYISSVLDLFSIPNFYIRKGRPHGHRYGKKEGCKEFHTAKQLQKSCRKKHYENIHDRFIRDTWFKKDDDRVGSLWRSHPWNGQTCKRRPQSYCHRKRNWCISW